MATTAKKVDTVGINTAGIAKIKDALEKYKSNVKKNTAVGVTKAQIEKAIQGTSSEAAFKTAAAGLDSAVEDLLSYVAAFEKKLDGLKGQYEKFDKSVSYNLTGSKK